MVKRPRPHQLETKSRIAFEDAIPDHWLLQRPDSDYGIDGNVLIFDSTKHELKFNFLLQLKSTEQSADDFKVQISTERLREYSAYDSPVYIFGWNEISKTLYYINATEVEFDPSAASRQLTLGIANKWNCETSAEIIERSVERRQALLFKKSQVGTARVLLSELTSNVRTFKITQVLADLLDQDRRHFVIGDNIDHPDIRARIDDNSIIVNYFGLFSRLISINQSIDNSFIIKNIIAWHLVEHLYELSLPNFASTFIRCIDYSIRHDDMQALYPKLFSMFVEHDNLHGISQIADIVLDPEKIESNAEYVINVFGMAGQKATPEALTIIGTKLLENNPLTQINQTRAYNMGNLLGTIGKHALAIKYFMAAFRGESKRYIKSGYAFREFAASFFALDRYHFASVFYRKALSLEGNVDWYGLLGDALFFNCRFDQAMQAFSLYVGATQFVGGETHPEWELKKELSEFLYKNFSDGVGDGNATHHTSDKVTSPKFLIRAIDLRPPAGAEFWFNRAVFFAENDRQSACMYMTLAACLDCQNVVLWVNAFFWAWNWLLSAAMGSDRTYSQYFLSVLYLTGRHWIGRSFDAVLLDRIQAKKGDPRYESTMKDFVAGLAEEADRRLKLTRKEKGYFTFRLYASGERPARRNLLQ